MTCDSYVEMIVSVSRFSPADGAVVCLLPDAGGVLVGLQVCAGVGGAARPVVEGGDGPGRAGEVLQTAGGGQSLGGALDHRDQNVPLSCKSTRQDKPRRGI